MKNYTFVKNIKGSLTITLESWNMSLPTRNFSIANNVSQIAIPEEYALGLFISESAISMLEQGYFVISNINELKKKAQELGLFADREYENCLTIAEIEGYLLKGNEQKITEILERKKQVEINNLIVLARENIDSLQGGIINKIETACGAELRIE